MRIQDTFEFNFCPKSFYFWVSAFILQVVNQTIHVLFRHLRQSQARISLDIIERKILKGGIIVFNVRCALHPTFYDLRRQIPKKFLLSLVSTKLQWPFDSSSSHSSAFDKIHSRVRLHQNDSGWFIWDFWWFFLKGRYLVCLWHSTHRFQCIAWIFAHSLLNKTWFWITQI